MAIVRRSLAAIRKAGGGTANRARLQRMTDAEIDRQIRSDPDVAPDISALGLPLPNVKSIRVRLKLSQAEFARRLGIPVATIRNWEQRRTVPDPAAVALLTILDRVPSALRALSRAA